MTVSDCLDDAVSPVVGPVLAAGQPPPLIAKRPAVYAEAVYCEAFYVDD